ncbi:hypothetical protein AGMMS50284_5360 [Clostridia bacterium]|nr:hypothetical protein AGMMS50284_5360 [Clostridia bacterium]
MKKIITVLLGIVAASTFLTSCAAADGEGGGMSPYLIVIYIVIIGALYFFMIRPNSKKKKEEQAMRNNIEIGDDVTTIGGIVGKVVSIKDDIDSFVLETGADRTKILFKKWAIASIDTEKETTATDKKADKKAKKNEKD